MIRVQLPDKVIGISFAYLSKVEAGDPNKSLSEYLSKTVLDMFEVRYTNCELFLLDNEAPMALVKGEARCSRQDNFNKAVGRKVALAKALKEINLPKQERKLIWEAYHSRDKKPDA